MSAQSTRRSLLDGFFQLGYVTRDLDAAIANFGERFGPAEFQVIPGSPQYPHTRRIALSWIGDTMTELIEPNPSVSSLYLESLPAASGDVRFHHIGCLIDDYPAMLRRLEERGHPIAMALSYGETLDCCYADLRPQLGHYLEYIRLGDEGRKWFTSVPGYRRFPGG
jgi:hypothetical protein